MAYSQKLVIDEVQRNQDDLVMKNIMDPYYFSQNPLADFDSNEEKPETKKKRKIEHKTASKSIDGFFGKRNQMKLKKVMTSSVGQARANGVSYISVAEEEGSATHLIKIEVFDFNKIRGIPQTEQWKHADVRLKYVTSSVNDELKQHCDDVIYKITKTIAENPKCKSFFFDSDKNK